MEPKGLAYFAELIRALSQPTSYCAALQGDIDNHAEWWAELRAPPGAELLQERPVTPNGGSAPPTSRACFRSSARSWTSSSGASRRAEGKPDARLFVEKMPPTFFGQALWRELVPGDARDLPRARPARCRVLDLRVPAQARPELVRRSSARTEEDVIREPLGDGVGVLMHCWKQRCRRRSAAALRGPDRRPARLAAGHLRAPGRRRLGRDGRGSHRAGGPLGGLAAHAARHELGRAGFGRAMARGALAFAAACLRGGIRPRAGGVRVRVTDARLRPTASSIERRRARGPRAARARAARACAASGGSCPTGPLRGAHRLQQRVQHVLHHVLERAQPAAAQDVAGAGRRRSASRSLRTCR